MSEKVFKILSQYNNVIMTPRRKQKEKKLHISIQHNKLKQLKLHWTYCL